MIYSHNYKIGLEDIGIDFEATNKAILAIMEDVAVLHSTSVGYGVFEVETKKRVWMLLDWKMKVIRRPIYNEHIVAETWSRNIEKLYAYRDFQIKDKRGNVIAIGTSRWIFVDTDRRRPLKITEEIAELYGTEKDKSVFPESIEEVECKDCLFIKEYKIQRRDIDINEHMHNLSYLDMAYEILPEEVYRKKIFDNVRIVYKKEILYGQTVDCCYEERDNYYIVTAKVEDKVKAIIELF